MNANGGWVESGLELLKNHLICISFAPKNNLKRAFFFFIFF